MRLTGLPGVIAIALLGCAAQASAQALRPEVFFGGDPDDRSGPEAFPNCPDDGPRLVPQRERRAHRQGEPRLRPAAAPDDVELAAGLNRHRVVHPVEHAPAGGV